MGRKYSGDPKSDHSKTGNIRNPDVSKSGFQIVKIQNGRKKLLAQVVLYIIFSFLLISNDLGQQKMADTSKTGPFKNRTKVKHPNSGHVRILDPHCTIIFQKVIIPNFFTIRLPDQSGTVRIQNTDQSDYIQKAITI